MTKKGLLKVAPPSEIVIEKLKNGDHNAFDIVFQRYSIKLYHFAFKYLKNAEEAQDIVQSTFLAVWDTRERLDPTKSFSSYLFTIAFNFIKKSFIKNELNTNMKEFIEEFGINQSRDIDGDVSNKILLNMLEQVINQMPSRRREAYVKKKFYQMSLKEIAEQMEISEKTVTNHITEAQKYIIKTLGPLFKTI